MDVVIPIKIRSPSLRISKDKDESKDKINCKISLDMLEERREQAITVVEARRQHVTRWFAQEPSMLEA